jgi:hypothetical protein
MLLFQGARLARSCTEVEIANAIIAISTAADATHSWYCRTVPYCCSSMLSTLVASDLRPSKRQSGTVITSASNVRSSVLSHKT